MPDSFEDLAVWRAAHKCALEVYRVTASFPQEERYGLAQQMRRSAVSVAANIAEGQQRSTVPDFQRFLDIASGSAAELKYYVLLARDLEYMAEGASAELLSSIAGTIRMLASFRASRGS